MKKFLVFTNLMTLSLGAVAGHVDDHKHTPHSSVNESQVKRSQTNHTCWIEESSAKEGKVIKAEVKGMYCPLCAKSLEKEFSKNEKVSEVKASLEEQEVTLALKTGEDLSSEEITEAITSKGFAVNNIIECKPKIKQQG